MTVFPMAVFQWITGRSTRQIAIAGVGSIIAIASTIASLPSSATVQLKAQANSTILTLEPGFAPDPHISAGLSGGAQETANCGYINGDRPNLVVEIPQPFPFLRASIQAEADVTLLIETPSGQLICSDDVQGLLPEISGEAPAGTYKLWVGDFVGKAEGSYRYRLSLTAQPD
jgi:hypothetical protein